MVRLKELGYSYAMIGALYGVSRQRIHQLISGYDKNCASLQHGNGWYRRIHNIVIKRDEGKCQKCAEGKNLIVHHLDGNVSNNKFSNLITLCNQCHLDLHRPNGHKTSPAMSQIGEAVAMITKAGND